MTLIQPLNGTNPNKLVYKFFFPVVATLLNNYFAIRTNSHLLAR